MTTRAAAALAALVLCAVAGAAPAAAAEDVDTETFRELAVRAADDPAARARLGRVGTVDGRPVDVERALAGAEGQELRQRLELLAEGTGAPPSADARAARAAAEEILAEGRFHERDPPRPLRGVIVWIGERLEPLVRLVERLAGLVPGGGRTLWALAGAAVALAAAAVALRLAGRRSAQVLAGGTGARGSPGPASARRLEHEADEAERRGEHERALRLRFRAGLLRLDELDVLEFRESLATAAVARQLRLEAFDRLAASFDEVVYGGRPARADDARGAREGWRRVLQEVVRT